MRHNYRCVGGSTKDEKCFARFGGANTLKKGHFASRSLHLIRMVLSVWQDGKEAIEMITVSPQFQILEYFKTRIAFSKVAAL